jgi:Fe-S cluster assembly protein SufD
MTTTETSPRPATAPAAPNGLAEHSHVGGRTVGNAGIASHLHPVASGDVAAHPVPTSKSELWRFAPLRRFKHLHADADFDDGSLDWADDLPGGATARRVAGDQARQLKGASGYVPTERFTARVMAESAESLLVEVPPEAEAGDPVVVRLSGSGTDRVIAEHVVIRIGHHADATVVLRYEGSATVADVVEIDVGDGARATVVAVSDWAEDTVHLTHHNISVGRDARVKHSALTFGGEVSRLSIDVSYRGTGGDVELLGLYFADAGQYMEHRMFIDHDQPNCKSNVLFKGALQGQGARTAWVGDVLIRKAAAGTDTFEVNRNLILTDGARADSVPNLEIETGEIIGAGHASATGRFDDEHLFYLQSRGITPEMAKRLVVRGFFHEVLNKIGVPAVVDHISQTVEKELAISGN